MAAPDRCRGRITIAQHEEENVPRLKLVTFPVAFDRIRTPACIDFRELGVLAKRIGPLAEPGARVLIVVHTVVIARNIVDIFAAVLLQGVILLDKNLSILVGWRKLTGAEVAHVDHDIPVETGRTFDTSFRLANHLRKTLPSVANVGRHMGIAGGPHAESTVLRWCSQRLHTEQQAKTKRKKMGSSGIHGHTCPAVFRSMDTDIQYSTEPVSSPRFRAMSDRR